MDQIPSKPILVALAVGLGIWANKPTFYTPAIDFDYTANEKKGVFSKKEVDTTLIKLGSAKTRRIERYQT